MNYKFNIIDDKSLECKIVEFSNANFKLDSDYILNNFKIAFKSFGTLNKKKNNVILVCHALTGDQFAAEINPITKKEGWWSNALGPGKAIDTNKYFVICANVLGGCMGSFGPSHENPKTEMIYGLSLIHI